MNDTTSTREVAKVTPSRLPLAPAVAKEFEIQPTDWRVLVEQVFPSAKSPDAVLLALSYCRNRGLDIFKRPVHIVPMWSSTLRKTVETVWPGISELRTTASRTQAYAGIDATEYGPDVERTFAGRVKRDNKYTEVEKTVTFPEWASVVVYRMVDGQRCPFHAKVFWLEAYATTGGTELPNEMWSKRAYGQLDKCAEAAALRRAFPEEMGSDYTADEMEGRSIDHGVAVAVPEGQRPPPINQAEEKPETASEPEIEDAKVVEEDQPTNEPHIADEDRDPIPTEDAGQPPPIPDNLDRSKQTAKKGKETTTKPKSKLPPFPGVEDPEAFRSWVEKVLEGVTGREPPGEIDELLKVYEALVLPHVEELFPPDQEDIEAIYQRHEKRLEP